MERNRSSVDVIEVLREITREYIKDENLMAAWATADMDGEIPDWAGDLIARHLTAHLKERPEDRPYMNCVMHIARAIAEGRFDSIDGPTTEEFLTHARFSLERNVQAWAVRRSRASH